MTEFLRTSFGNRDDLVQYVRQLCPWAEGDESEIVGGAEPMNELLLRVSPSQYGRTRNFGSGGVTRLSPYISRGVVSLNHVRNTAIERCDRPAQAYKFIQELAWRDFWHRVISQNPAWLWNDIEPYKTGFDRSEYAAELPTDIAEGRTGVRCIDYFIDQIISTGYLHNHARMYLASYVVHFRRVAWQAGARWFMSHLLDGDMASNNLSWQWVASTYSNKPYIFNLDNVQKYFSDLVDTSPGVNLPLNKDYATLRRDLFPNLDDDHAE